MYIPRTLFVSWEEGGTKDEAEDGHVSLHFSVPLEHLIEAIEVCSAGLDSPRRCQSATKVSTIELCWKEEMSKLIVRYGLMLLGC